MKYCVTIEYVQRKKIWFEAENEREAKLKGCQLYELTEPDDDFPDKEWDYCIADEDGRVIADWD